MIHLDLIRNRLKLLREQQQISAETIAEALNIDTSNYHRIENGKRKKLDLEELDIICDVLNVSMIDVLKQGYFVREKDSDELRKELLHLIEKYAEETQRLALLQGQYIERLLSLQNNE